MKRVHVHIDRITLDGVADVDGAAVAAAIQRELARRVGGEPPRQSTTRGQVDAGTVQLPGAATADQVGRAVGGSVHHAIRKASK